MESLHTKILDAARDEVAKEYGFDEWSMMMYSLGEDDIQHLSRMSKRAALLAMEKQAEFYREISHQGYVCLFRSQLWTKPKTDETKTELELYNIWREGK